MYYEGLGSPEKGKLEHLKVKGKVVPVHNMKAYRGQRGIAPTILNLTTIWK
jgi:hypothetical protein